MIMTKNNSAGFTLIELLIGLVILAILLAGAIPAFRTFVQNNRLDSLANDFVAAAHLARSEAINRGTDVTLCPSANGSSCGGSFADGWIVLANQGSAGDEVLIQTWPSPGADFNFSSSESVRFQRNGFADPDSIDEIVLELSECSNDNARRIDIQRTGRVASIREDCA